MAVLAECPMCHRKQKVRNKLCECGTDLDKLKKQRVKKTDGEKEWYEGKVRYWIIYRMPDGKQRKEFVGTSIEDARTADGKRRVQKKENRIFDIKPEVKMTFNELTEWYLNLEKVKALAAFSRVKGALGNFNSEFGDVVVSKIKPMDLENYQAKRLRDGRAQATIDQEIGSAKTMIIKAFDNDLVGGETLRTFKKVKRLLKVNGNARDRILTLGEFDSLMVCLPTHTKQIFATAFYTGMRLGEIVSLTWDKVDLKNRVIKLEARDTKDREPREIPICDGLYAILRDIPRPIHHNHVFTYNGEPMGRYLYSALQNACKKAGITYGRFIKGGFVFHDLRHTFNTYMRKAGVQESVIMEITGHSTRAMFDRYNTVDIDDKRQAVTQLQGFLGNVAQTVAQVAKIEP